MIGFDFREDLEVVFINLNFYNFLQIYFYNFLQIYFYNYFFYSTIICYVSPLKRYQT